MCRLDYSIPVLRRLQASCVEPLLGVCDDAHGLPCMVLRRSAVPRLPLQELLNNTRPQTGAFLWRHKLTVAHAVAKGLAELHAARVLVPNLSSRNVLVPGDGLLTGDFADIKLIDVGVALAQRATETLTLGTGGCRSLAPEVLRTHGLETSYSDVYAFGVLLLELNTHQIPFYEIKRDTEARSAIASGRQPRFTSDCPLWYKDLALACMRMDPFARPSLEEVTASLEAHLNGTGLDPLLGTSGHTYQMWSHVESRLRRLGGVRRDATERRPQHWRRHLLQCVHRHVCLAVRDRQAPESVPSERRPRPARDVSP